MDPEESANELADTFRSKARLPEAATNAYMHLPMHPTGVQQNGFLRLRTRTVYKWLKDINDCFSDLAENDFRSFT